MSAPRGEEAQPQHAQNFLFLFATTPRAVSDEVNDELCSVIKCALPSI